jgi:chorismate mutase/prephenate dehydratase
MSGPDATDPRITELREQLSDNDVKIVEAVNARLELVARLKQVKDELGVDFLDPTREAWLLQYLADANQGPLSAEGLRELYTTLLDLTKRELGRPEAV